MISKFTAKSLIMQLIAINTLGIMPVFSQSYDTNNDQSSMNQNSNQGYGSDTNGNANSGGYGSNFDNSGNSSNNSNNTNNSNNPYDQTYQNNGQNGNFDNNSNGGQNSKTKQAKPKKPQMIKPATKQQSIPVTYVQQFQWSKRGNLIHETASLGVSSTAKAPQAAGYQVPIFGPKSFEIKKVGINSYSEEFTLTDKQAKGQLSLEISQSNTNLKFKSITVSVNNFVVATQANFTKQGVVTVDLKGKANSGQNQILVEMSGPATLGVSYKVLAQEDAPEPIITLSGPTTYTVKTAGKNVFTENINLTREQLGNKMTLDLSKGGPAQSKFNDLSVSINGYIVATQKNFDKDDSVKIDVSKQLTRLSNQLLINAQAPMMTSLTYKLTIPQTKTMREEASDALPYILENGKKYTVQSVAVNKYKETFSLKPGEEHLPLNLNFELSGTANGFRRLQVTLNGVNIASINDFKKGKLSLNVINQLIPGDNELLVQSQGAQGATFSWSLTSPKLILKSTRPEPCAMGDTIDVLGKNFPTYRKPNLKFGYVENVTFDNIKGTVSMATPTALKVIVPDKLEPGVVKLQVKVGRLKSKELKITVKADPIAYGVDHVNIPPGQTLVIRGTGFANSPSKIKVTMRGQKCEVVSASKNSISIKIPESLDMESPGVSAMNPNDQANSQSEPGQGGFTNIELESDGVKAKYQPKQDLFPGITQPSSLGVGVYIREIGPSNQTTMP